VQFQGFGAAAWVPPRNASLSAVASRGDPDLRTPWPSGRAGRTAVSR